MVDRRRLRERAGICDRLALAHVKSGAIVQWPSRTVSRRMILPLPRAGTDCIEKAMEHIAGSLP